MPNFIFANNISTTLAGAVSTSATTITLANTANLPASIPAGEVLVITLNDAATRQNFEIVYATARTGTTLTVERAQEGTTALSWLTGDLAYSSPTAGQMGNFFQLPQAVGRLLNVQVFTESGTYTPSSSLVTSVIARIQGGGGGSAGSVATGSTQISVGGPGGSGGYCETHMAAGTVSGTVVTVGAGGSAAAAGAAGNNGSASSFAGCTAGGGYGGGISGTSFTSALAGTTGVASASGGNILNIAGGGGSLSFGVSVSGVYFAIPGQGSSSPIGGQSQPSNNGQGYGAGAGGTANTYSQPAIPGYAGSQGVVIIYEYA